MLIKFPAKTKYFSNFVLPFALLFQWTLPTIENLIYIRTNFGDLIYDKCKNSKHSHPPLSQRETSNDPEKFVNSDLNNSILIKELLKLFYISGEKYFEKSITFPALLLEQLPPSRAPPFFEV